MDTGGIAIPAKTTGNLTKNRYQSKIVRSCLLSKGHRIALPLALPLTLPISQRISARMASQLLATSLCSPLLRFLIATCPLSRSRAPMMMA